MAFLTRDQLFVVFVIVTLIDLTTAFRTVHESGRVFSFGGIVLTVVLVFDVWILWKLAWLTDATKPPPSYQVT